MLKRGKDASKRRKTRDRKARNREEYDTCNTDLILTGSITVPSATEQVLWKAVQRLRSLRPHLVGCQPSPADMVTSTVIRPSLRILLQPPMVPLKNSVRY